MSSSPPPTSMSDEAAPDGSNKKAINNNNQQQQQQQQQNNENSCNHNNNNNNKTKGYINATTSSSSNSIDKLSPDQDIFINPADGLPSQHPTLPELNEEDEGTDGDPDSFDDLPTSVIVTNIHSEVFTNDQMKSEMEDLFRSFSESATFQWLRSFRRLRVNYDNALAAASARIKLHQYEFNKKTVISCYFAQPVTPVSHKSLQPPAPVKQFLISPPASPPAGWEPRDENEPLVNHDLLAALASLTPGESHELHPQSDDQPGIIVHTAKLSETAAAAAILQKQPISHTKCPERV